VASNPRLQSYAIPNLQMFHILSNFFHNSSTLMAYDHWLFHDKITTPEMLHLFPVQPSLILDQKELALH
jgi:hypothetical protein